MYARYQETTNRVGPRTCSVGTLIGLALPISMIVMGAMYLDDCPAERYIPIYLIVSGSFSVVYAILRVMSSWLTSQEDKAPGTLEKLSGVIGLFMFAWFIAGNVWIYRLYNKYSTDPDDENYCNDTLYQYAFWVTAVTYILIGVVLSIFCCICCCTACIARKATRGQTV